LFKRRTRRSLVAGVALAAALAGSLPAFSSATASAAPAADTPEAGEYIVVAKSPGDLDALKQDLQSSGITVQDDLSQVGAVSVSVDAAQAAKLSTDSHVATLAKNNRRSLIAPEDTTPQTFSQLKHEHAAEIALQDPAYSAPGLMWNLDRIESPRADKITSGKGDVIVAVADTGLDFTHSELAGKIIGQEDFTAAESPPICSTYFGGSDQDAADFYGGPANTDWNGHGTWIGGNIAANADGIGINGIAPTVKLFDLKISQWCGSAYDSTILSSFLYAADHGIDIVSISFGGYLDRTDPDQEAIYQAYVQAVAYAKTKGTIIVAAAGNEHVRIGDGGVVLSHGSLTLPGDPVEDLYGLYETPGGIPGVVMVSSTGNVTMAASKKCAPDNDVSAAVCKPKSDAHQPIAAGKKDQLAYYSNYGPRIDIAAPGGARKFNLPAADRGGSPGFPDTIADGTTAFEEFSITSNWALEIPCTVFTNGPFYLGECYSTIQGTSMATPHVSAVAALIVSAHKSARHNPDKILKYLKDGARSATNYTPALSASDTSPGDRTHLACPDGYCHLGGKAISSREAYGAGILDAYKSVK